MKIEELETIVAKQKEMKLDRAILVITRAHPPSGNRIRVNGMGYGEIANVHEKERGIFQTVAWFKISDIERYLVKVKAVFQAASIYE